MNLCFSCISYLSFGNEIAEEIKTQLLDLNQQQHARSIYRLHRFAGQG